MSFSGAHEDIALTLGFGKYIHYAHTHTFLMILRVQLILGAVSLCLAAVLVLVYANMMHLQGRGSAGHASPSAQATTGIHAVPNGLWQTLACTTIVTTAPQPSAPSPDLLAATLRGIATHMPWLRDQPIIVSFDGCRLPNDPQRLNERCRTPFDAGVYEEYKRRARAVATTIFPQCTFNELEERGCLTTSLRTAAFTEREMPPNTDCGKSMEIGSLRV